MIRIEGVTKSFGEKKVIENLNLEVKANEIVTLLGPNGCGKTTILNILSGLTKPEQGNIYINDILVNGKTASKKIYLNPSERKIGYVFQTISLFPHMRIQDNIAYGLKAMHFPKQEVRKRTESLLDFVGLREYARFYPHQLSGGQRQRTALARSLATEPKVLLLDEPVSAVDPQLRESFRLELKNYLQNLNITVLYVTHNLSEAVIMSDRIAVIGNGHIEQIGNGAELFDKPSSKYVAKFLGINAFKGKVTKTQGKLMEIEASGTLLLLPFASKLIGKNVIITIKPENITLSKSADTNTKRDGINSIEGVITEMVQMRSNAQITIDVGFPLKTRLLLNVVKDLGLALGEKVYVHFAADSLNVFADDNNE
jgi:ABC-type Fe3+/spermidine/putrescine transport system ATPase subunit